MTVVKQPERDPDISREQEHGGELGQRALRATGNYQRVLEAGSAVNGDYLLRGKLHEFGEVDGARLFVAGQFLGCVVERSSIAAGGIGAQDDQGGSQRSGPANRVTKCQV